MRFRSNRIIPQRISQASALIVIAEFMPERVLEKEREAGKRREQRACGERYDNNWIKWMSLNDTHYITRPITEAIVITESALRNAREVDLE